MKEKYFPQEIEAKWQKRWADGKTFEVTEDSTRPKFYCLEMLAYTSGRAHIGHQVCQILLVGRGNNARRYAGLIIDRFETCGGAHRRHAGRVRTGGSAFVQDRAIRQHRNSLPLAFDHCRLPRFGEIRHRVLLLHAARLDAAVGGHESGQPVVGVGAPPVMLPQ